MARGKDIEGLKDAVKERIVPLLVEINENLDASDLLADSVGDTTTWSGGTGIIYKTRNPIISDSKKSVLLLDLTESSRKSLACQKKGVIRLRLRSYQVAIAIYASCFRLEVGRGGASFFVEEVLLIWVLLVRIVEQIDLAVDAAIFLPKLFKVQLPLYLQQEFVG